MKELTPQQMKLISGGFMAVRQSPFQQLIGGSDRKACLDFRLRLTLSARYSGPAPDPVGAALRFICGVVPPSAYFLQPLLIARTRAGAGLAAIASLSGRSNDSCCAAHHTNQCQSDGQFPHAFHGLSPHQIWAFLEAPFVRPKQWALCDGVMVSP
jgi:hypothetical protein